MCGYYTSKLPLWSRIQPIQFQDPSTLIAKDRQGSTLGRITILHSSDLYICTSCKAFIDISHAGVYIRQAVTSFY